MKTSIAIKGDGTPYLSPDKSKQVSYFNQQVKPSYFNKNIEIMFNIQTSKNDFVEKYNTEPTLIVINKFDSKGLLNYLNYNINNVSDNPTLSKLFGMEIKETILLEDEIFKIY